MQYDYVILGAGAVGMATALAVKRKSPSVSVLVLDRCKDIGKFASGNNAGLIHSGIHEDRRHILKSQLCLRGNNLMRDFCRKYNIPLVRSGMLVAVSVWLHKSQLQSAHERLEDLAYNADELGIPYEVLDAKQVMNISGNRNTAEALYIKNVYLLDIHRYLSGLRDLLRDNNIILFLGAVISEVTQRGKNWIISLDTNEEIQGRCIINCTGSHADEVAALFGFEIPVEYLYQGDFYSVRGRGIAEQIRVPINSVMPKGHGKGVHAYKTLSGSVWLGPITKIAIERSFKKLLSPKPIPVSEEELKQHAQLFFGETKASFSLDTIGFRPKIVPAGADDDFHFCFLRGAAPRFASFYGIQSPGLTASLALGEYAANRLCL